MNVVEWKRAQRASNWLAEQVGHEGVGEACVKLADARRASPSNVEKVSGLVPPQRFAVATETDVSSHLAEIARILGGR